MDGTLSTSGSERQEEGLVRVFERVPDLLASTSSAHATFLRDHGTVPSVVVGVGPWHPPSHPQSTRHWLGLVLVDGFLARPLAIDRLRGYELLGPGDLLRPWDRVRWEGAARGRLPWAVLAPATVGILDQDFAAAVSRAPGVTAELLSRALQRTTSVAAGIAVASAGEVVDRIRALLAHVADRWGEPVDGGLALPTALGDQALAYLVHADPGQVTAALGVLADDGSLARRSGRLVFGD